MRLAFAVLVCMAFGGCRHPPPPAPRDLAVDDIRRAIARCPVPLTDEALDDLTTYEQCVLPPAIARLVRNDYADDELEVPDFGALARHAGRIPRSTFEAQLRRFVDPRGALAGVVEIDPRRNVLRPDPVLAPGVEVPFAPEPRGDACSCRDATTANGPCSPESACRGRLVPSPQPERPYRSMRRAELLAVASPGRPLAGMRVGVDPGHAGGPYALMEERQVAAPATQGMRALVVREGDLTLRTALELRAKLVARGAEVILTRDAPALVHRQPLHAFRPAAELLLRRIALDEAYRGIERALAPEDRLRLRSALAVFAVRKQNRFESLRARARLLSAARPDVVLSIHYNAAPFGTGRPGPQELVAMVGGFHEAPRLYNPYHRWRALEAAFAVDDFDASAHLGALCVRAMSERLGIPAARENRYQDHLAIVDGAGEPLGVDAWDGALLRYVDGVALLTEGPYLNERDEMVRLLDALAAPLGTAGTRVERYADALASCVQEFAWRWLGSERNPFSGDP